MRFLEGKHASHRTDNQNVERILCNGRKVRELQQEAVDMYDVHEAFHSARSVVDTQRCGQKGLLVTECWHCASVFVVVSVYAVLKSEACVVISRRGCEHNAL